MYLSGELDIWPWDRVSWNTAPRPPKFISGGSTFSVVWSDAFQEKFSWRRQGSVPFRRVFSTWTLLDVLVCARVPDATSVHLPYPCCVSGMTPSYHVVNSCWLLTPVFYFFEDFRRFSILEEILFALDLSHYSRSTGPTKNLDLDIMWKLHNGEQVTRSDVTKFARVSVDLYLYSLPGWRACRV